jgi:hypothetical protein
LAFKKRFGVQGNILQEVSMKLIFRINELYGVMNRVDELCEGRIYMYPNGAYAIYDIVKFLDIVNDVRIELKYKKLN